VQEYSLSRPSSAAFRHARGKFGGIAAAAMTVPDYHTTDERPVDFAPSGEQGLWLSRNGEQIA
jgi:hypothetical protein